MATKSNLISSINSFLTATVTILKHRNSMLEVINELFATSNNYTVTTGNIQYDLTFTKSGNKCLVTGSIKNASSSIIGNTKLLDIPNSLYYPKISQLSTGVGSSSLSNSIIAFTDSTFLLYPNSIFINSNLGVGSTLIINTSYIVND